MNLPAMIQGMQTKEFSSGLLIGMLFFGLIWMYSLVLKARVLYQCATQVTPTKIGNNFYYIVPESVYNKLTLSNLQGGSGAQGDEA